MRKILLLVFIFVTSVSAFGQDLSNKGKDFWVGYGYHGNMTAAGGSQNMLLYFATDQITNVTVSIPGLGYTVTYPNIPAGTTYAIPTPMPKNGPFDSKLRLESTAPEDKGIHITSDKPIIAYAHIYDGSVSGATILYPTNTLGKEYYSVNYDNYSNVDNANCWMYVIASDTGTTVVEITPIVPTINHLANVPFTVSLTQGQVYNLMATYDNATRKGGDLTGSKIRSLSGSGGCKRIAVFSGSGRINLTCPSAPSNASSDNYMVQALPKTAWGKTYLTVPTAGYNNNAVGLPYAFNTYRICVLDPATVVTVDGVPLNPATLINNFYYSITQTNVVHKIEADQSIMVAQYLPSRSNCGNPASTDGDPEVIYLSPIEQSINTVRWLACRNSGINSNKHYINVVIPNTGTALTSLTLDGATVPAANFTVHPQHPSYSYAVLNVTGTNAAPGLSHVLQSDSGFNAIAYGYGSAESYGYNAGTNLKDLTKQLEIETTYGIETSPSVCTNSPFKFKVYFPAFTNSIPPQPNTFDSLDWNITDPSIIVTNNFPIRYISPVPDSTNIRNGELVNWYSLPSLYYFTAPATDTLMVTTYRSTNEGCGTSVEYPFEIVINAPPTASFTAPAPGCYLEPVIATETTPQLPKPTYKRWWEFYDPVTNLTTVYVTSPGFPYTSVSHTFTTPGVKRIRHASITTPGCLSDTIVQNVTLPDIPNATIAGNTTVCINTGTVPVTFTGTEGTAPYTFSYTINGVLPAQTVTSLTNSITIQAPTNVAGPFVYNLVGVTNALPVGTPCTRVIAGQSVTVNITPDATVTLRPGDNDNQTVCVNNPIINIRYDIGGSGNGGTVTGLPPGITGTYAAGVVTITGTPTSVVGSPFTYTIVPAGPCAFPVPPVTGTITVNDDATIALTSPGGTDNQTKCINTLIDNIDYLVAGGGTGATIVWTPGVPPGISFTPLGGNTFRISGTPTAAGTFNYTVSTTGPCIKPTATGTLIITPDATVTLRPGDNNNQVVCVNNPITNIRYDIGGSGNGGTVTGLPAGVTGTYAAGVITIVGTPTSAVGSPFTYTIIPTGPCAFPVPPVTGTITVDDDATITLTSASGTNNQTICINTSVTDIDYQVAGGGTGATIAWTPGAPAGISFTPLGGNNFRISGIATAAGTYNYTISTTGPCIKPTATGTLVVNPDHTIGFNGGVANPTVCVNTVMPAFTLVIGGGANNILAPTGLPPGVTATVTGNIVTISGTPTLQGSYTYTITTDGNACVRATYTNTITVTADATLVRTSAAGTDAQELCRNSTIANITYDFGGSATGATVSGLPPGVTWSITGNTVTIVGTPTVSSPAAYTYSVNTLGPCVKPNVTGTILVNALPTAAFTYTAPSCETRDILFTDGSSPNIGALDLWNWSFGDPASGPLNTSGLQNPVHVYATPGTYTVTLSVRNDKGCISDPISSTNITINHRPQAGFIVPEVCINDVATQFIDTSKIASGTINRALNEWLYNDPNATPGNPNTSIGQDGLHLYTATGTYNVRQIVTSSLGCRDTITLPIIINSADPASNFTVGNSCSSDSVSLVNLSTVGFGNVTRLDIYWDDIGTPGVFETINTPVFNGVYKHKYPTLQVNRTYNIRMVAYSGNICFAQRITPVTVYATPVVQFNNIPNTCYLVAPFQLTQGSEIGGVPGTGTYSGPGITNPSGTFNPQVAGIGTHNIKYTWTASNAGACIDTLTRTITVLDTAHATFSVTLPSCEQTPTLFTNLSTAPASVTLANTVWNFGDATGPQTFAIAAPVSHTYANPGTYTVTMHNVSAAGCLSTDTSASITIDANHHITLNGGSNNNQTVCVNTSIAPISYTLSGGATNVTIPALPAGLTYTVAGTPPVLTITGAPASAAGSPYNFSVQTTGNTCQVATTSITITVDPDHVISRNSGDSVQSVCVNTAIDPIVYNLSGGATGAVVANLPPGVTFNITGTLLTISGTPTSTAGSPYNFSIQTTGNSCVKANTLGEIKVNPYPVPAFTFDKTSYCIPNATVGFINNTTPAPTTLYTYNWDFGDGGTASGINASHLYTSAGPFTVTLKARSTVLLNGGVIGCESSKSNLLDIIHPQPKADFVFSKPAGVCIGDNVLITDATDNKDGLPDKYFWDLGDGTTENTYTFTHTYPDTATYVITMYTVNSFGCNSDTINKLPLVGAPYKPFTVYPYPHVNAGLDKNVLEGGSVQLTATAYGIQPQYAWTPVEYLTDSKILQPRVVNPKTDMTYRLTVTGKGGCQISDNVFVKLLKFPVIANTFSPNGDGINDQWRIDFLNTYPDNRVQIFTRAGKLVFESKGYNTPWDGTLKGKPLPFDTYYYIIEPGNGRDPITGYVTILK